MGSILGPPIVGNSHIDCPNSQQGYKPSQKLVLVYIHICIGDHTTYKGLRGVSQWGEGITSRRRRRFTAVFGVAWYWLAGHGKDHTSYSPRVDIIDIGRQVAYDSKPT